MKKRQSNLELLRLVSIFMIILFHCAFKSGFQFEPGFSFNKLLVKSFWMLGELGVNLFMLTSGYFMVRGRFRWKKLVRLLVQVQFYHWLSILLAIQLGEFQFTGWKSVLLAFFPVTLGQYWFITAYLLVCLFSPFFNLLIGAMDLSAYRRLLLTCLVLFCAIPTAFGVFYNDTEVFLYYNRFIWLVIVYFIGGYIRTREGAIPERAAGKYALWTALAACAVLLASILVIDRFSGFFARLGVTEPAYFWPPNTIPMLALSLGVFGLFLHWQLPCLPAVNTLASTTLGIYLLHDGVLAPWLWKTALRCAEHQDSAFLVCRILAAAAGIFAVGAVLDLLRQGLERYTLDRLLNRGPFREPSGADGGEGS